MGELMKLESQHFLFPNDVKSLGGRMARARNTNYYRDCYQTDLPDNSDSYEF